MLGLVNPIRPLVLNITELSYALPLNPVMYSKGWYPDRGLRCIVSLTVGSRNVNVFWTSYALA